MGRVFIEYIQQQQANTDKKGRGKAAHLQNPTASAAAVAAKEEKKVEGQLIFTCNTCGIHLADNVDFISKDFRGKTGTAFLFGKVINVFLGPQSEKEMMTGRHIVADIYCVQCSCLIGWTYLKAHQKDQKYKEGKSIIERAYLKPLGLNAEKYQAPDGDDSDDQDQGMRFARLLASSRTGRPGTASRLNIQQLFPGVRGSLIRQALGMGGDSQSEDVDEDDDSDDVAQDSENATMHNH